MKRYRFALGLTLCAYALRLWRVDAQSLRGDEAFDVLFASQRVREVLYQNVVNQAYPPLYHTLLHFWLRLAGYSELSARFLALCAGVLLVPLVYRLAGELFGESAARMAAVLAAAHPFLLWHSQDGRMYAMLAVYVSLAAWFALRLWRAQSPSGAARTAGTVEWAGYIVASVLGILTQYFAYLAVFSLNVLALYVGWRRWSPAFARRWLAAQVLVALPAAGWLLLGWARLSEHYEPWIAPVTAWDVLQRSLLAYSLGMTIDWLPALPWLALAVALLALGLLAPGRRALPAGRLIAAGLCFLPLLAIYAGSLARPMFDEKYLIFIVPFYLALMARGLTTLGRWQLAGLAFMLGGMALSLYNYQFDARFAKAPPWRELAQSILAQQQAGDVVVYNFPDPALLYQLDSSVPVVLLPGQSTYSAGGALPVDASATEADLWRLSRRYERVWFVPQASPDWDREGTVGQWLTRFAEQDRESGFGSLKVRRYLTPRAYQKNWKVLNAQFGDGIRLVAYHFSPPSEPPALPQVVRLALYWRATASVSKDYTVFVHCLDEAGVLRAQQDNPPVAGTYPTTAWRPGQTIVDLHEVTIPADAPLGRYHLTVGLYEANGRRLAAGDADELILAEMSRQ